MSTASVLDNARLWIIYGLIAGKEGRIRYVGFTRSPHKRMMSHLHRGRNHTGSHRLYDWVSAVLKAGDVIEMVTLEHGIGDGWQNAEKRWIAHFGRPNLCNGTDGGDWMPGLSEESLARMREKLKKRVFTPEHRARIAASKRGKPRPDAARFLRALNNRLTAQQRSENGRRAALSITEEGRARLRESGRRNSLKRWQSVTPEERQAIAQNASAQMRRVWQERKAANGC